MAAGTEAAAPSRTLVLFDIDGTLLRTEGVGVAAMLSALRRLHGDRGFSFDGMQIAGALDGLLFAAMAERHGLPSDDTAHDHFVATYRDELERTLTPARTRRLSGTAELAGALLAEGAAVGLLTGNYEPTARIKIAAAGLDDAHFPFGAFGRDGPSRRHLTPVARARAEAHHGRPFAFERTVVIGDTPLDVDCALAHGCRALAVATGPFDRSSLERAGADLAVEDLSDTPRLLDWIL
jgi:phosphoglycolate phosphatase